MEEDQGNVEKIEKLIVEVVEKEIRKAREENERLARDRAERTGRALPKEEKKLDKNVLPLSGENAVLAGSFAELKSRMAWPVSSGFISSHFGRQAHPILKGIYVENHGITIQTNKGEEVKAVFDGQVSYVGAIQGIKLVAIQHGDYFTVYNRLKVLWVKSGQKVKSQESIGEVMTNAEGVTELQFQIWKNNEKLDPENWLLNP
jgi:septal ring factor EnvC (AmiA/AmiB activator)